MRGLRALWCLFPWLSFHQRAPAKASAETLENHEWGLASQGSGLPGICQVLPASPFPSHGATSTLVGWLVGESLHRGEAVNGSSTQVPFSSRSCVCSSLVLAGMFNSWTRSIKVQGKRGMSKANTVKLHNFKVWKIQRSCLDSKNNLMLLFKPGKTSPAGMIR